MKLTYEEKNDWCYDLEKRENDILSSTYLTVISMSLTLALRPRRAPGLTYSQRDSRERRLSFPWFTNTRRPRRAARRASRAR